MRGSAVSDVVFFGKFDAMSRATNGTIGCVPGLRMVSNDYLFVPRGIIIVAVHANGECNPVG